ncbi:transcriptional corepressor LEUNIG-like protein [Trifolium pratense]|uniref:Transcriptional corepressor LEUNIG-like protein n=1 Tax=Trifolium pratense TaxID=57577 RepID=A0A2K3P289_TRIPR|nr:transcriptional corepressor LEUNIG-like protein [Trifolium pratense]
MFVDSPEGVLHEWWSVFSEVFSSRIRSRQESEPQSPNMVVPRMIDTSMNISSLRIPQMPMNEQRPQQFQASSSFNNMMAQSASRLMPPRQHNNNPPGNLAEHMDPSVVALINENDPNFFSRMSSNHPLQDVGNQLQKQVHKDNGIVMRVKPPVPSNPLDVRQKAMLPSGGPQVTNNYKVPNLVPINGVPLNNQMLTSLLQMTNYGQQCQVLNTQNQEAIPTQALASTPNIQTFAAPINSARCDSQYPEIPKAESSNKDREMMDQTIRAEEPQCKQDQQMQSQNLDNSGNRKIVAPLGAGECVPDRVDAADENVDSYLSIENGNADHKTTPFSNLTRNLGTDRRSGNKVGFTFQEVGCLHSSKSKVLASHFSSNGKVLASAGHDKKVFIWNMETFQNVATEETHSLLITDVRFRPGSTIFATSSFDKSIKLWDANKPNKSLFKLNGHSEQVMSLDFHPRKADVLCSCDGNEIIRLWNVNQRECKHVTKGGSKQVRFQPLYGKLLGTATGNTLRIFDVEADKFVLNLKGHDKDVVSICWDISGKYIASVSEDRARVWSDGKCINELLSNGNKFQSCIFHPAYSNLLVVGGYQSLELWSPTEGNKTESISAHKGLIAGLADSPQNELIASASHDCLVKLWK